LFFTVLNIEDTDTQSFVSKGLLAIRGDAWLDVLGIIWGWAFIFQSPGIASLRVIRVLRLLWYFKLLFPPDVYRTELKSKAFIGVKQLVYCLSNYLSQLGLEFSSGQSTGALAVIGLYFFLVFIFGVLFWNEEQYLDTDDGYLCATLTTCCLTLMRLSFYDSHGLNFLQAIVTTESIGMSFLIFAFLILSTFILLNGNYSF